MPTFDEEIEVQAALADEGRPIYLDRIHNGW
jgi:hypothetical protein